MGLSVIVLAAGNGKRMFSGVPKVLHELAGVPMVERVVRTAEQLNPDSIHVVYGSGGAQVRQSLTHLPVNWIKQEERQGTGHAVSQAVPFCHKDDQVLVLYGDVPLISEETLSKLLQQTPDSALGLVIIDKKNPSGLGRIIRNELGNITAIVEEKDATELEKKITEVNTGILTASVKQLQKWLPQLKNDNKQNEYYLTDIVSFAVRDGIAVGGVISHCEKEVQGVNDRWQLASLERHFQLEQAKALTYSGVKVLDPYRLDIRGQVSVGRDSILDVNVILEGDVVIGNNCFIGPNVILKNVTLGDDVTIAANSLVEHATINDKATVGPFARIRPETTIGKGAKVGNFVEIKASDIGAGSKVSHLSYIGDATLGCGVNIGAGTITCNYDGVNKWQTVIQDGAFVGSNSSLVAPLTVGCDATIGAGSTVSRDAPAEQLTLERAQQRTVSSWKRPEKVLETVTET